MYAICLVEVDSMCCAFLISIIFNKWHLKLNLNLQLEGQRDPGTCGSGLEVSRAALARDLQGSITGHGSIFRVAIALLLLNWSY